MNASVSFLSKACQLLSIHLVPIMHRGNVLRIMHLYSPNIWFHHITRCTVNNMNSTTTQFHLCMYASVSFLSKACLFLSIHIFPFMHRGNVLRIMCLYSPNIWLHHITWCTANDIDTKVNHRISLLNILIEDGPPTCQSFYTCKSKHGYLYKSKILISRMPQRSDGFP